MRGYGCEQGGPLHAGSARYRIVEPLERGDMGEVVLTNDT